MKLEDHVERIRLKVEDAVKNALDRCGITVETWDKDRDADSNIEIGNYKQLIESIQPGKDWSYCYDEIVDDYAFTLFNRLICMKVLESHGLYPEMVTQRQQHSGKSYAHYMWLETNGQYSRVPFEGLEKYLSWQFDQLSPECDLFAVSIPLHMIPTATFCKEIIDLINAVDEDDQVENDIWKQGNILSQIYEIYNNSKKAALKASGDKVEYDKVHVQSQIYTPEWVVQFLVDNSLGKLYLEMYPDSDIKNQHKIIGDFLEATREKKQLDEIKIIDPCVGSGNFLLYCYDLLYEMYMDQIDNYGADYSKRKVPELIIERNLHGIDLDERAVQLTKVGLFIKAKTRRSSVHISHYNVVSASFRLPEYSDIGTLFDVQYFSKQFSDLLKDVWGDLQQAYKFGSLLRIDEKFEDVKKALKEDIGDAQLSLFTYEKAAEFDLFEKSFYEKLGDAIGRFAVDDKKKFFAEAASNALTYLKIITEKYEVVVSNPPYTDSGDFGDVLLKFSKENYQKKCKSNGNLFSMFVYRNINFADKDGYVALIHPHTIMTIKTYADVREYLLQHCQIQSFIDYGLDRVNLFGPKILVESVFYVLKKSTEEGESIWFNIDKNQQEKFKMDSFKECLDDVLTGKKNDRVFISKQKDFTLISGMPFVYELSDTFKEQFNEKTIGEIGYPVLGLKTSNNKKYLRYWWELDNVTEKEWPFYAKGGDFNRWYGNNWLRINWINDGAEIKREAHSQMIEKGWDFKEGVTVSTRSVKGSSARLLSSDMLFDMAASSIISINTDDTLFILGFSNSKVFSFVLDTLNNTVNKQPQDLRRIPIGNVSEEIKSLVSLYAQKCIELKKDICKCWSTEPDFEKTVIDRFYEGSLEGTMYAYINYYNKSQCYIAVYEALINKTIYSMYGLSNTDIELIENRCDGILVDKRLSKRAKEAFLAECDNEDIVQYVASIKSSDEEITLELEELYKPTTDILDYSSLKNVNPIEVWYQVSKKKPSVKTLRDKVLLDYLFVKAKDVLLSSENGLLSIWKTGTEKTLCECVIEDIIGSISEKMITEIEGYLGCDIGKYFDSEFMSKYSNYLNLFMYLPQTPIIWHICSKNKAISLYCHIHRFNGNTLYQIKNKYAKNKRDQIEFRIASLGEVKTAQQQLEKEKLQEQIVEIDEFIKSIDKLISTGYSYDMERGVAANIAPLQSLRLISYDVLSMKQLQEYLKAEW